MLHWLERLEDGLFQKSRSMGPPWGATLRWLRYPAALIRDWLSGDIGIRAMSLAYTTLLSLVPLMVFTFAILKGLGAHADLRLLVHEFFRPVGSAATQLTESVMQFVANMRGELLGSIGLAFLVYTVITTIQKVETSFNFVWRVERPRSFGRRFTEYLTVMILGPILLAVALGLLGSAENSPIARWLQAVAPLAAILRVAGRILPYAIVTVVFTCMYAFIPNIRLQLRHRADDADLGIPELAHPAHRRAARVLRAIPAIPSPRTGEHRTHRQRSRAGGSRDHVSDRARLRSGQEILDGGPASGRTRHPGHRARARARAPGARRFDRGNRK